jgi:uridine phosphorylase
MTHKAWSEIWDAYRYNGRVPKEGLKIDGRPALTGIDPARIGDFVFLFVRDPLCGYGSDPATELSERLEGAELVGQSGMFTSWSGIYKGTRISAISGGSGGPEAELAMFELLQNTKASTYLRVGGSGGTNELVRPGDVVIAKGIVRDDGLSAAYVGPGWPAVCDPDLVLALSEAAHRLGVSYHVGLTRSGDSDIVSGGRPSVHGYMRPDHTQVVDEFRRTGVLNGDREASAIVTMATLFGKRGGSVCSVADNIATGEAFAAGAGHKAAIEVALEGVVLLDQMDKAAAKAGLPRWLPSVGLPA